MKTIGIISDTHGLLRPQALQALAGSDLILHAGDIGNPDILDALGEIATVVTVRGNMDFGDWADDIPETKVVEIGGLSFYLLHDLEMLDLDPSAAKIDAVVFGHSHRPLLEQRKGVWYINPGSAGHRRFNLPVTLGRMVVEGDSIYPKIIELV